MRTCPGCTDTHKFIYYRRLTPVPDTRDLLKALTQQRSNAGGDNTWNEDFTLHSTYDDAKSGANPWKCPGDSFNYDADFYGECSPDGNRVRDQYTKWDWYPGPQSDVVFYVNTPQDVGLEELDLATSEIFSSEHTDVDLGAVSIAGRTFVRESDNAIIMTGAGWDIWNRNGMGHYFSQPWEGDVDIEVHVSSFTNIVNKYAKAGTMIRADNSDDSTHVFGLLSGKQGICLRCRPRTPS